MASQSLSMRPHYLVPVSLSVLASELAQIPASVGPPVVPELSVDDRVVGPGGLSNDSCLGSSTGILQCTKLMS